LVTLPKRAVSRVLLEIHRADHADAASARPAFFQRRDGGAHRRLAAPCHLRPISQTPGERRMVGVLHEQRVGLPRCEHADGFRGHRPLREPLH